jgi:N utilization substance protein B
MIRRRRARNVVLQILVEDDMNPQRNMAESDQFLRRRLRHFPETLDFAQALLAGVRRSRPELDQRLAVVAQNWRLERMAVTDRNVLRLGLYEILYADTPGVVAIDEAVELAKRYGTALSGQFVNGILDRCLHAPRTTAETNAAAPVEADADGSGPRDPGD